MYLQYSVGSSIAFAVFAMLVFRGLLSIVRRWLILRERVTPETDVMQRTVETNRAIFWRRVLYTSAIPILYFVVMNLIFGYGPVDAIAVIPQVLQAVFTNLLYVLFLIVAQFMIFFLPIYIYIRIGKKKIMNRATIRNRT